MIECKVKIVSLFSSQFILSLRQLFSCSLFKTLVLIVSNTFLKFIWFNEFFSRLCKIENKKKEKLADESLSGRNLFKYFYLSICLSFVVFFLLFHLSRFCRKGKFSFKFGYLGRHIAYTYFVYYLRIFLFLYEFDDQHLSLHCSICFHYLIDILFCKYLWLKAIHKDRY